MSAKWREVSLHQAQLLYRTHSPDRFGGRSHSARGGLDELEQAARGLSGKGIAGGGIEQRLARHHVETPRGLCLKPRGDSTQFDSKTPSRSRREREVGEMNQGRRS